MHFDKTKDYKVADLTRAIDLDGEKILEFIGRRVFMALKPVKVDRKPITAVPIDHFKKGIAMFGQGENSDEILKFIRHFDHDGN